MPRITLPITCLFLLTSSALIAANDNPFARWENLKKQTEASSKKSGQDSSAKTAPAKSKTGSVAYFSPTASDKVEVVKPEAAEATKIKRERLRSGSLETGKPASPSAVRTAAFTENADSGNIRQTAGDFLDHFDTEESNATPNPFEEFLGDAVDTPPQPEIVETNSSFDIPDNSSDEATPFGDPETAEVSDFTTAAFEDAVPPTTAFAPAVSDTTLPVALNGPQTPSVTLQWVHHGEFNLGQECRCDLILENTGTSLVRNVIAEALLPQGLQVVKSQPAPSSVDGTATWTFGEMQPGEKRKVELVVIPQQQGDAQISAFVRMTGASTSTFSVTQPQLVVQIEGPDGVEVGQQVNYTVRVANPGSGIARNVVIQAAIPEGLEHRQGSMLSIEIGTLNPGEQRRARLSVTGVKGGEHKMAVRVVGEGGLQEQAIETVAIAEPRLNIGVRGSEVARAGQLADYELIVVNEGRVDSSNVRAKYKVPAGFEFVKADLGGKYDSKDDTINWFVGTLEPNQVRRFHVSLRPTAPGKVRHQVGVISEHGKMTMADLETTVQGNAELELKLVGNKPQMTPGDIVTYEIDVENVGQSTALNVGVSFELSPGMQLQKISGPSEYVDDNGAVIFRSLAGLEAGKSVTITVQAKCNRAGRHNIRARVASESIEEALIKEQSTVAR